MNGELRKRAEAFLQANPEETSALSTSEPQQMIHELDVHQVELQMQNDELTNTLQELEESHAAYAELYDAAPVGYLTCDRNGVITRANQTLAGMLGVGRRALLGRRLSDFIVAGSQDKWYRQRRALLAGAERLGTALELQPAEGPHIHVQFECRAAPGATDAEWCCRGALANITDRIVREAELRRLASELALAEQRERQRVAGELHDRLSQQLHSANDWLDGIPAEGLSENTARSFGKVREILKETIGLIRSLTFGFSCPGLQELGLAAALEELCNSMSHERVIRFTFNCNVETLHMALDRQLILYRAVRELLINVLKHSGANVAEVWMACIDHHVRIMVSDDGRGFDPRAMGCGFTPTGGAGLFNLGEFLRHLGGDLKIDSSSDRGTKVTISMPLEEV